MCCFLAWLFEKLRKKEEQEGLEEEENPWSSDFDFKQKMDSCKNPKALNSENITECKSNDLPRTRDEIADQYRSSP